MLFTIVILTAIAMLAFEFESLVSFFVYLHFAENLYTSAEKVCLNEVGCFENSFPWATFPTEKWPIVRMRSMPLEPNQINAKLVACHGSDWVSVENQAEFDNWYDYKKVSIFSKFGTFLSKLTTKPFSGIIFQTFLQVIYAETILS